MQLSSFTITSSHTENVFFFVSPVTEALENKALLLALVNMGSIEKYFLYAEMGNT